MTAISSFAGNLDAWIRNAATVVNNLSKSVDTLNGGTSQFVKYAIAPASPALGQVYFDTALVKLRYWNGTSWVSL